MSLEEIVSGTSDWVLIPSLSQMILIIISLQSLIAEDRGPQSARASKEAGILVDNKGGSMRLNPMRSAGVREGFVIWQTILSRSFREHGLVSTYASNIAFICTDLNGAQRGLCAIGWLSSNMGLRAQTAYGANEIQCTSQIQLLPRFALIDLGKSNSQARERVNLSYPEILGSRNNI